MRFSKAVLGLAVVLLGATIGLSAGQDDDSRAALLIIDIQQFYYPGGASSLVEPEAASRNASKVLGAFRSRGDLVVHVRHKASKGTEIHDHVAPIEGEEVFTKSEVSCFNGTGLLAYLQKEKVSKLVIAGMMTHMCVEAAVRAAYDQGHLEPQVVSGAHRSLDAHMGHHARDHELRDLLFLQVGQQASAVETAHLALGEHLLAFDRCNVLAPRPK